MSISYTTRFGRSDEELTLGWLTRPGYTSSRFMAKVKRSGTCWLWRAQLDRDGYGRFSLNGQRRGAHRVAYEAIHGPMAPGMTIDHICRVRHCVNPDHLEAITHKENVNRGLRKLKFEEIVKQSTVGNWRHFHGSTGNRPKIVHDGGLSC